MKKIRLQLVADSEVPLKIIQRSMENQDDIALQADMLNFQDIDNIVVDDAPDVFLVSMKFEKPELASVIKINQQLKRPVLVYTSFADQPGYLTYLKKAGAFEVIPKLPPKNSQQSGFFRHLGIKLASLTRSAHARYIKENAQSHVVAVQTNAHKVPVTGFPAKVVLAVGLESPDPRPLLELMVGLKKMHGVAFIVAHRFPDDLAKKLVVTLNANMDYSLTMASSGQAINEHTAFFVPSKSHIKVSRGRKIVIEPIEDEDETGPIPSFDEFFESVAEAYGKSAMGVLLGEPKNDGKLGLNDLIRAGAITFAQSADENAPEKVEDGVRRMPIKLLSMAVRRNLLKYPGVTGS